MNTESQDLSLRQESEKLTYTINGKKTDSRKLPVENLIGAPKKWRVRDVSEAHVVSIRTAFLSVNEVDIANPLSVIPTEDGKFFVIDGNHRLEAIKRHRLSHPDSFKHVLCHVYEHLRPDEIIAVAVRRNCENNVLPMSEWDKVDLFRRYFKNDSVDTAGLIYGYSMLGITTRKQKQALTPVTFLAGFSEQCFDKLKELRKKEDAPRTPSVFNSFRKWGEAERLHALGIYQLEGKQSFQRHCRKAQAKNNSHCVEIDVSGDTICFRRGKTEFAATSIKLHVADRPSSEIDLAKFRRLITHMAMGEDGEAEEEDDSEDNDGDSSDNPSHMFTNNVDDDHAETSFASDDERQNDAENRTADRPSLKTYSTKGRTYSKKGQTTEEIPSKVFSTKTDMATVEDDEEDGDSLNTDDGDSSDNHSHIFTNNVDDVFDFKLHLENSFASDRSSVKNNAAKRRFSSRSASTDESLQSAKKPKKSISSQKGESVEYNSQHPDDDRQSDAERRTAGRSGLKTYSKNRQTTKQIHAKVFSTKTGESQKSANDDSQKGGSAEYDSKGTDDDTQSDTEIQIARSPLLSSFSKKPQTTGQIPAKVFSTNTDTEEKQDQINEGVEPESKSVYAHYKIKPFPLKVNTGDLLLLKPGQGGTEFEIENRLPWLARVISTSGKRTKIDYLSLDENNKQWIEGAYAFLNINADSIIAKLCFNDSVMEDRLLEELQKLSGL